ncbi:hypothetical protein LTR85_000005 [Meristemomyces frigidus]|nr:hypothetical protein LTR85_000005 [Meristemomyces frigidus]
MRGATFRPSMLTVSREVRDESLPVFYSIHHFRFMDCNASKCLEWLVMVGQTVSLKYIGLLSIPQYSEEYSGHWAAIVLLTEAFQCGFSVGKSDWKRFEQALKAVKSVRKRDRVTKETLQGKSVEELLSIVEGCVGFEVPDDS